MTSTASGPLHGVRVVELVGIGPGPFAAMLLADLGADVIRVDRPGGNALQLGPADKDILGRGRPSVAIDLKQPRGVETVLELVESADILIEGLRPGVTERLGLGPTECHARNPRLVYGRMTGWGQSGPLSQVAGHDINYIAIAGALGAIGRAGGPPQVPLNLVGDFAGGALYLVTGVLAALTHARSTGEGQVVDAAITDGTAHLMSMIVSMQQSGGWSDQRGTNLLDTGTPFYDVFETSDGGWMAVGPLEPQFFGAFMTGLGLTDAPGQFELARWGELRALLTETFAARTRAEWEQAFDGTDACVAPVLSLPEAYAHPHNVARGTYVEKDGLTQPAPAPRFSATPATLTTPPQPAGASTTDALTAWGIADVAGLVADGVAVQAVTTDNAKD
jgi:alpha-methylacyl-CoA racemase